ncbi:MAG TPA: sigma-70 family RNA polymerase sigma factor [Rubricoccaceae bacterium]|nr:sigma-70 family RNA polymerase sigma factor [Rubricoccaceae bacterium]
MPTPSLSAPRIDTALTSNLQRAAERYAENPTPEFGRAVAVAALPLVRALARRVSLPDHPLATYRDLENAGMLGMLQALQSYDPSRGTSFASFAYGRIRGALVDFLRTIDTLSRDRRRRVAEALRAADELQQEMGAEPRAAQVADRLGLPLSEYDRLRTDAQQRFTLSLHESDSSDSYVSPIETLPHPEPEEALEAFERQSLFEHVQTLIARFPEREQRIIRLYYFENQTLREIADQLSLTEARISQILSKLLRTLRHQLEAAGTAV